MTEREALAAELALGLLEGEDAARARALQASDPAFAADVGRWEAQLAPMLDEVAQVSPGADVWGRIERELAGAEPATNEIALRRRVRTWQWTAGLSAAAAIVMAALTVDPSPPRRAAPDPVLAGSIPIEDTPLRLALTYLPERRELLVSAAGVAGDGQHDHELWLVPPQGDPLSLGVVEPGAEHRVALAPAVARRIGAGAKLALTREPLGGKPAGRDAGPVVGLGTLTEI